jgi:uncharacterized protein YneF (UPF0154 family)
MTLITLLRILVLGAGYVGGYFIGSVILRKILNEVDPSIKTDIKPEVLKVGRWIGACEHFLIVTFVLVNEYTAIGLIFAAKELVRSQEIKKKASYYLLGTLLSVSFAILFGLLTKQALSWLS